MRRLPTIRGLHLLLLCVPLLIASGPFQVQAQEQGTAAHSGPGPSQEFFPGYTAVRSQEVLPSIVPVPISQTPLSEPPYVFALERRTPAQMLPDDAAVVSSLGPELSEKAALANFDLAEPGWRYQQIVCPAFPDYLFLDFSHGPEPNGSSHFVASLARNGPQVRIVSGFAHGALPFESAWNKPATYEIFNHILRQERGLRPITSAPNWLVIGMCFAELSGHHVQVLTPKELVGTFLDMVRLQGNQPQMQIDPGHGTEITFSDLSRPGVTTEWTLHFDRHGQLTSASREGDRQPANIALKP